MLRDLDRRRPQPAGKRGGAGDRSELVYNWTVLLYWKAPVAGPKSLIL